MVLYKTKLRVLETGAITHILEQLVREYITDTNHTEWKRDLCTTNVGHKNMLTYFYRTPNTNKEGRPIYIYLFG